MMRWHLEGGTQKMVTGSTVPVTLALLVLLDLMLAPLGEHFIEKGLA